MRRLAIPWALALCACGGPVFTTAEKQPLGEAGVDDAAEASEPDVGRDAPPVEADVDADPDAAPDAGADADGGRVCLSDLSGVGSRDFSVGFTLTTLAGSVDMALLNQRQGCDESSAWWDVSYIPSTATKGALAVATCDGASTHYVTLEQATCPNPDDGQPHRVVVERKGGQLSFRIDGALCAGPVADPYALGALPALRVGADDCPGFAPTVGSVTDVCLTEP